MYMKVIGQRDFFKEIEPSLTKSDEDMLKGKSMDEGFAQKLFKKIRGAQKSDPFFQTQPIVESPPQSKDPHPQGQEEAKLEQYSQIVKQLQAELEQKDKEIKSIFNEKAN